MNSLIATASHPPHSAVIIGCGYLGERVAQRWMAEGTQITVLTRNATRAARFQQQGWQTVLGDVTDPSSLRSLPTATVLLYSVGFDRSAAASQQAVTVGGLQHVLDELAGRVERVLYTSTTSVYGQSDGSWVDETSVCEPVQPGGVCALQAEHLLREWSYARNCPALILRLAGLYGPGRLLAKVEQLRRGEPLAGRGDAYLNLVHIDDVARLIKSVWPIAGDYVDPVSIDSTSQVPSPPTKLDLLLVSDQQPVTRAEYYHALAAQALAPAPLFDEDKTPRRGSGGLNKRCRTDRLRQIPGFQLQFPTIATGLPAAWKMTTGGP